MAQTKIYPATQTQAQTIIDKVDAIDAKIVAPTYQDKTVTPSDIQQIVQADNGYNALHSVTVEPVAAAMSENLEEFIMNTAQEPYSLSLSGNVPDYACYEKTYLKRVYGNITSVGNSAFFNCSSLQNVDVSNATTISNYAFRGSSSLQNVDVSNAKTISGYAFTDCKSLQNVNAPNATILDISAFQNCTALHSADLRQLNRITSYSQFSDCTNLMYVDYRNLNNFVSQKCFEKCTSLSLIDFTNVFSTPTLGNVNNFSDTNNDWIAVVANDTMKAAFQSATNWSTYASHFRTIAEVEAEVGMSYDDYYLQCFGHPRF